MANNVTFTKTLAAADDDGVSASQSPGAAVILINGALASSGVATVDTYNTTTNTAPGRQVVLTSGGDDHLITFTFNGTAAGGISISETVAGTNASTSTTTLNFLTVTSVTHTGTIAGTIKVGTNGIGASEWNTLNYMGDSPMNVGALVELVSGSANFSLQISYDDPNNLSNGLTQPFAVTPTAWSAKSATLDGAFTTPFIAVRLLTNSGTGTLRVRFVQAGIG